MTTKKKLVVFAFDCTIINVDSERTQFPLLPEEVYTTMLEKFNASPYNWIDFMNSIYAQFKKFHITLEDIKNVLDSIERFF